MNQTTINIWDRDALFRDALQSLLHELDFRVVSTFDDPTDAVKRVDDVCGPALVICGLDSCDKLPDALVRRTLENRSNVRVILLAENPTSLLARQAAEAGVHAVLSWNISGEVLKQAVEFVLLGQTCFPAQNDYHLGTRRAVTLPVEAPLNCNSEADQAVQRSRRERQILAHLTAGASNKDIARELGLSEATVKVHIKGLLRRLKVKNRTQAAIWELNNPLPVIHDSAA